MTRGAWEQTRGAHVVHAEASVAPADTPASTGKLRAEPCGARGGSPPTAEGATVRRAPLTGAPGVGACLERPQEYWGEARGTCDLWNTLMG